MFADLMGSSQFIESLDFEVDSAFQARVYTYLKDKMSNAEPIDVRNFSFFNEYVKDEIRGFFIKAVNDLDHEKMLKVVSLAVLVGDEKLLESLSISTRRAYLDSFLSLSIIDSSSLHLSFG